MTQKLFDEGELFEFEATVLSCEQGKKCYEVTLDRSAFFPEGGGQAGDVGTLGGVKVIDTQEKGGVVYHKTDKPLEVGAKVKGVIDRAVRLRRMQNHSGEHLIMGFIHARFGYENVGFHLGKDEVTLDLNGVISYEQLLECEQQANEAIAQDRPITISYPDDETLSTLAYRSKLENMENVRIVTIEGIDVCACCAPHLSSTGKIGVVKVLTAESYKGGTRVHILCGLDAVAEYEKKQAIVKELQRLLSAKPEKILDSVKRLLDENGELKKKLTDIANAQADSIIASLKNDGRGSFCTFTEGLDSNALRRIANEGVKLTDGVFGAFNKTEGGYSYIIASEKVALRAKAKEINTALGGKGGGSDAMIQGSITAGEQAVREYFAGL